MRRRVLFTRGLLVAVAVIAALVVAFVAPHLGPERAGQREARYTPRAERRPALPAQRPVTAPVPAAPAPQHARVPARPTPAVPQPAAATPRAARPGSESAAGPRMAIVIDDLGQNISHLEQLAALDIPISIAVIPGLPASTRTVREASRRGIEMLLHQPMEPREEGGKNPGEGVLLTAMTAEDLRARVRANLAAVPGAVGVNNHMGSKFTEDPAGLGALMAEIKEHGLFWLDSRTTAGTRGAEVALAAGVRAIERDVFIDAEVSADFIRRQVRKLIDDARVRGAAVGIGHPHPETIAVLRELRGELLASGVALVPVSALVRAAPASAPAGALAAATPRAGRGGGAEATAGTATP